MGLYTIIAEVFHADICANWLQGQGGRPLPIGLQIVGRNFDEAGIIQLANVFEQTVALDRTLKTAVA